MQKHRLDIFNQVYANVQMYYGWETRREFNEFIESEIFSDATALDLGCGEGRYSIYLAKQGFSITAVDVAEVGINKLEKIAVAQQLEIACILKDLSEFNFNDEAYNVIVAATILDHLEQPIREQVVTGIKRSLKPGGIIYANVFTVQDPGYQQRRRNGINTTPHQTYGISDCETCVEHYYSFGELRSQFADLEVLYYAETLEPDSSHGTPHHHGWASLIARKLL